jgi:sporulation protein YlmC with PRC-barrel domain
VESEFRAGAAVECTDGHAGKLQRLVIDPGTEKVTHLVVESQPHFGIPVLVPRELVTASDGDTIRLNCTQADLKQMDPFEEVMYTPPSGQTEGVGSMPAPYSFPAPGLGMAPVGGIGGAFGSASMAPPVVEEVVPKGEVVVGRDAIVQARDGDVGHVDDVLTDAATGRLTHLVVRSGHLWATHSFRLPASVIERVEEGNVRLRLTRQEVETIAREGEGAVGRGAGAPAAPPAVVPTASGTGEAGVVANATTPVVRIVQPPTEPGTTGGAMATMPPTAPRGTHLVGLFATREQAEEAIDALIAGGFPSDALSAVTAEGRSVSFPTARSRAGSR